MYLTRHPLKNAISFFNRNKNFEMDNFNLDFKKNIFKIGKIDTFEKYLWMWIEIKLRLIKLQYRYKFQIIHFKSENIDNISYLNKLFYDLGIKHNNITIQKRMNTNQASGFEDTKINEIFLEKFENFKKIVPFSIREQVPEFYKYDEIQNFI